jgi:hypothetical protein
MALHFAIMPRRAARSTRVTFYPVCAVGFSLGDKVTLVWSLPLSLHLTPVLHRRGASCCGAETRTLLTDLFNFSYSFALTFSTFLIRITIRILVFWTVILYSFGLLNGDTIQFWSSERWYYTVLVFWTVILYNSGLLNGDTIQFWRYTPIFRRRCCLLFQGRNG